MEGTDDMVARLWEYIDGICDEAEQQNVAHLIATDIVWKEQYDELMAFNTSIIASIETEEPSVRFTRNVMEMIAATSIAPKASTYINPAIIRGIAAFFIISILLVTGYAFTTVNWSAPMAAPKLNFPELHVDKYFNSPVINVIIGANVILGLLFADMMLRRKDRKKQHQ